MRRLMATAVVAVASLSVAPRGRAADAGAEAQAVAASKRQVGDHVFTPSRLVTTPFTTTTFGSTTIYGEGTATGNSYDVFGHVIGGREHDIAAYGQALDYSIRVVPALSLRVAFAASLYTGTDGRSFFAAGTTVQTSGGVGATLARTFGRAFRAALVVDASSQPTHDFVVANAVLEAIDTGQIDSGTFLVKGTRVRVVPGASFAWAPHPAVGFVGTGAWVWSHRTSGSGDVQESGSTFAASADVDLGRLTPVALALMGFYRWEGAGGLERVQDFGGGFFYTGRPALQLGLEVTWRDQVLRPDVQRLPLDAVIGSVVLRYYW